MKSKSILAAAVVAATLSPIALPPAVAQQAAMQVKDLEAKLSLVKLTADVAAVDLKNRIVTLVGPEGNTFAVHVDAAVKNLPQVKVGDKLVVEYYESVVLDFQKGDGIRMATSFDDSARAKAGQKPGAAALSTVTLVSNIWAVNPAKGTVLVRGPYGHFTEVKLKDPSMLAGVKVGDQMKITYTQAVAVAVSKA
ncbi:MAG: hypothetical protein J0L57_01365 [Burkholderiales bacterium]|nr:hypothetical protein [Burkholderiales bacterium]